jgi:tRNA threonylcarbamoyladenosine biosynthesis protein TsaE
MQVSQDLSIRYSASADDLGSLPRIAEEILGIIKDHKALLFYGDMGAGKTTLINAICMVLKVQDSTSSPTYSLVNEYLTRGGETVYHFDFYRVKNEHEALDIGVEEYFSSGNYCFIEWPEKIKNLLPQNAVEVHIGVQEGKRIFSVVAPGMAH